jgi:hypothetical protein
MLVLLSSTLFVADQRQFEYSRTGQIKDDHRAWFSAAAPALPVTHR